jgi:hypothetical protein
LIRRADFAGESPSFFFEWADGEASGVETLAEILRNKWLETATAFALGDVDELMDEQLAIAPTIGPDNDPVADAGAARRGSDDVAAARDLRQPLIVRQRKSFHDQNPDARTIPNAGSTRISGVLSR